MEEDEQTRREKEIAFYSAVVDAWVTTRMEKDRTILTLSAGGIGLLATLLTTVGPSSNTELWLTVGAAVSLLVTAIATLKVFDLNSVHLREIIKGKRDDNKRLVSLDRIAFYSFVLGVVLTSSVAVLAGVGHMTRRNSMSRDTEIKTTVGGNTEQKSLTGMGELRPAPANSGSGNQSSGGTSQTGNPPAKSGS